MKDFTTYNGVLRKHDHSYRANMDTTSGHEVLKSDVNVKDLIAAITIVIDLTRIDTKIFVMHSSSPSLKWESHGSCEFSSLLKRTQRRHHTKNSPYPTPTI